MTNIELFNDVTAEIFRQLYSNFPRPITIEVSKIKSSVRIPKEAWWEDTRWKLNPVGCALEWLRDEGFVRYKDQAAGLQFSDVILTSKGFAALNRSPESLETKPTIGERLKELSDTASTETVSGLVRLALSVFGGGG